MAWISAVCLGGYNYNFTPNLRNKYVLIMPKFEPTKRNLWEAMLFCYHLKNSAAGWHRLLVEYGNHTPTFQTVENWF